MYYGKDGVIEGGIEINDYLDTISTKNILGKTPGKDIKQKNTTQKKYIFKKNKKHI